MTIRDVRFETENYLYRTPIKFGGTALDRVTLLNVTVVVETDLGTATGFGSMPLGNVWAWPGTPYDTSLAAMQSVAGRIADVYRHARIQGHPIEITHTLEPVLFEEAKAVQPRMPLLAVLVVASAFDAALHDAYGKAHGLSCWKTYTREHLPRDLGEFLGPDFAGEHLSDYIQEEPKPKLPCYHLVGALDPLTDYDAINRVGDGLPESLEEWIVRDGLTHLKIKLNGDDLAWDIERILNVNTVAGKHHDRDWKFSLDFNERCPNVEYLVECLGRVHDCSAHAWKRIQYVEQPTPRDLRQAWNVHAAAMRVPVVIDESLLDVETLYLAVQRGYTGVAFKACKGQTQSLLLAAAARKMGLFLCVQDLTCPGASLIQSAGLAAHIPGVMAIEANSRQYVPAANTAWDAKFPGVFTIRDGVMNTAILTGPGLGAVS